MQRSGLESLLPTDQLELGSGERWLLSGAVIGTSGLLLLPSALFATVLSRWSSPRAARGAFIASASVVVFWLSLDQDLLSSIGRHLTEVAQIALLPRGHVAGGDLTSWAVNAALWLGVAIVWTWVSTLIAERVARTVMQRLSPSLGAFVELSFSLGVVGGYLAPLVMHASLRPQSLQERLYGALVLDLRVGVATHERPRFDDPVLDTLALELHDSYARAFAPMMGPKPADPSPLELGEAPPNVVLIVAESLRHDVFGPQLMPRLWRWARGGVVATRHDAGTMYSEAGMFALLFGRSPAVYHPTLDAGVPPQLCVTLRASGYQCGYFSGHPEVWKRREEFINAQIFEPFVHDDHGDWPEWDQRALTNMVEQLNSAEQPQLALVFLMSSHFEYRYPPEYEVDTPVAQSSWLVTQARALDDDDELPHRNRYRNCMRFIDDLVADAIARLDPARNLIVFTGDHGESLNDDGRFTHGYSFAEITTRTPLVLVGPQVPRATLTHPTEHRDLVATLATLLAGRPTQLAHTHGLDMLGAEQRAATLVSYATRSRDVIQAQLRHEDVRLRVDLDAHTPRVTLLGFEDVHARLLSRPDVDLARASRLAAAFEHELSLLRR